MPILSGVSQQPHMNQRNSMSLLILSLLNGIRLKSKFSIEQQTRNILIETRYSDFGSLVFAKSNMDHGSDKIAAYALFASRWRNNDVSNRTTTSDFPTIEVGEADNYII